MILYLSDVDVLDKARAIRRKKIEDRARSTICRVACRGDVILVHCARLKIHRGSCMLVCRRRSARKVRATVDVSRSSLQEAVSIFPNIWKFFQRCLRKSQKGSCSIAEKKNEIFHKTVWLFLDQVIIQHQNFLDQIGVWHTGIIKGNPRHRLRVQPEIQSGHLIGLLSCPHVTCALSKVWRRCM